MGLCGEKGGSREGWGEDAAAALLSWRAREKRALDRRAEQDGDN